MVGTISIIAPQPSRWVKGNAVGAGSFGVVNLAMDKATGELFVVKSSSSASGLLSLDNEADILGNLSSPYIVQCLGHESTKEANGRRNIRKYILLLGNYIPLLGKYILLLGKYILAYLLELYGVRNFMGLGDFPMGSDLFPLIGRFSSTR